MTQLYKEAIITNNLKIYLNDSITVFSLNSCTTLLIPSGQELIHVLFQNAHLTVTAYI